MSLMLGDLVEIKGGGTPNRSISKYWDGNIPWATVKDFKTKNISKTQESISEDGLENSASNLIPAGTIIVPTRMAVGKVAINSIDVAINQDLKALEIKDETRASKEFLVHFLDSKSTHLNSMSKGATVKGITLDVLRELKIPLPPLAEQKRIAAILDKADAISRKREEAIKLTDTLLKSVFLDMFGDPVTNPKGWEKVALGNLIKVSSGNGLVAKNMSSDGIYPVYGGNGINGHHSEYMFEKPQITIGRVGVYCGAIHKTKPKSWVTDNALYVKNYIREVDKTYLEFALIFANLNQYAGQAAQPLISGNRIYPVEIMLPCYGKQEKFAQIVNYFEQSLLPTKNSYKSIESLQQSLTQRAFRGELTSSDLTKIETQIEAAQ